MKFLLSIVALLSFTLLILIIGRKIWLYIYNRRYKFLGKDYQLTDYRKGLYEKLLTDEDSDVILGLKEATPLKAKEANKAPIEETEEFGEVGEPEDLAKPNIPLKKTSHLIVLHLVADENAPYGGHQLLHTLHSLHLKYGEHQIFHRYSLSGNKAHSQFSVTTINKPGTFDLSDIEFFSCPGLSLFMLSKADQHNSAIFESMVDVTKQIIEDLGGKILDERY